MSTSCVAISTTGDPHRLPLLAQSVKGWDESGVGGMYVTVDGDDEAVRRVFNVVSHWTESIYRVGGPAPMTIPPRMMYRDGRLGVAVNKNTGIELMMDNTRADDLFLSDDDTWPLKPEALDLHVSGNLQHSMVCWGYHRLEWSHSGYAEWSWPRGCVIYTRRPVIEQVGGMVEAFGPGGHEHVEWSRRIHQAGITPALYPSPVEYAHGSQSAMGAKDFWHAEDMPKPGEGIGQWRMRKRDLTSVKREHGDWEKIDAIMARQDGNTNFIPYDAGRNGRASATLYHSR